ncbi:hypothetical protein [Bacillus alveayuensis]|jgi:hypothetical protein|uniref:hypothetical protein n=1 Tax=Aeribacillus alveayuensis TaxID=279215 RepID=UPI0005CD058F|nr:hypothetical protein [Bacillus alveayuensis]
MRRIYEYLSVEEKKEVVKRLKKEREDLQKEINQNDNSFSPLVRQILNDTYDKWGLEIEELERDIENNIGPIKKI